MKGFISRNASIGNSTYIGSGVQIFGQVTIGSQCFIEDNVVIGHPGRKNVFQAIQNGFNPTELEPLEELTKESTFIGEKCYLRAGTYIGEGCTIRNYIYCDFNTHIGVRCTIGSNSQILYSAMIYDDVRVGNNCRIGGFCCNRSVIEDSVSMFGNLVHSYRLPIGGLIEPSPIIRRNATIGWNASIIGDVEIGENAYVAAGATVTKSIHPGHIVIGPDVHSFPLSEWRGKLRNTRES